MEPFLTSFLNSSKNKHTKGMVDCISLSYIKVVKNGITVNFYKENSSFFKSFLDI